MQAPEFPMGLDEVSSVTESQFNSPFVTSLSLFPLLPHGVVHESISNNLPAYKSLRNLTKHRQFLNRVKHTPTVCLRNSTSGCFLLNKYFFLIAES